MSKNNIFIKSIAICTIVLQKTNKYLTDYLGRYYDQFDKHNLFKLLRFQNRLFAIHILPVASMPKIDKNPYSKPDSRTLLVVVLAP